jgi:hypothetical protein
MTIYIQTCVLSYGVQIRDCASARLVWLLEGLELELEAGLLLRQLDDDEGGSQKRLF